MKLANLFYKPISRNINGVIKVGQQDDASIFQELDEYVVTKELDKHFRAFFDRYTDALDAPTDKMGVWISGFFGSGKSHFLKILSYLLENRVARDGEGGTQEAVEFFDEERIVDSMLRADITRSVQVPTDVILFNIDSKADATSKNQKDSIVKVFQKVFDEHLGYFGTVPAIAEFERTLDARDEYQGFKRAFEESSGQAWKDSRDAWLFHQEDIVQALMASTGMGEDAANRLVENYDKDYTLSAEKFACTVRDYLDRKGPNHRLIFMVDEVGQYIGENPDLMLNLQTVVEDLGVHCHGQAWVVVTSQEAMDEITKNRIKGNDFSKIVGRFYRPLSLSSANTDEVIKLRLLRKDAAAEPFLENLYTEKQAVLKNQISFTQDCADLPGYRNADEFVAAYPFIPYQFTLLQQVFTQVRLMGSAGKHLASGERSLLDAFQIAAQHLSDQPLDTRSPLVPFHTFYLAIEGFLDSAISQVITHANENEQLQEFDVDLLKTMFMVKYVKEVRASLDNLTTLSLDNIDQDKLVLRARIADALSRLEKQTLIQRVGDEYTFLTHEEQDIGREIKNTEVDPGEVTNELQALVWDSIFTDKKLKYSNRHQYGINRKLDDQTFGPQVNDFGLHILTPYADRFSELQDDAACLLATSAGQEALVRLPEDTRLLDELNELVQTAKYIRNKNSTNLTKSVRLILESRTTENSERRKRIEEKLRKLIAEASVFACGSKVEIGSRDTRSVLTEGLTYLVDNVYTKLNYVQSGFNTEDEVRNALVRDSEVQTLEGNHPNAPAHQEMKTWLADEQRSHRRVSVRGLRDKFERRPYGWSELDTLGAMAELVNMGKVELRRAQDTVTPREVGLVQKLRSRVGQDEYIVRLCDEVDPASLRVALELANSLLTNQAPPSDPMKLYEAYQQALQAKLNTLMQWLAQAERESLPFKALLAEKIEFIQTLLGQDGMASFFRTVKERRDSMEDFVDDLDILSSFFEQQLPLFQKARRDLSRLEPELRHLTDESLLSQVEEVKRVLALDDPTSQVPRLGMLLKPVQEAVQAQLSYQVQHLHQTGSDVQQQVAEYARTTYATLVEKLDLEALTRPLTTTLAAAAQASTIDSAIARQSELAHLKDQLLQQIDQKAAALIAAAVPENGPVKPPLGPIVKVKLATITYSPVLTTGQDVKNYLAAVEKRLMSELEQGHRIRLE